MLPLKRCGHEGVGHNGDRQRGTRGGGEQASEREAPRPHGRIDAEPCSMIRRNRTQATPTDRARRLRASARREEELRARGIDPYQAEMAYLESGGAVTARRRGPSIKTVLLLSLLLLMILVTFGGILLWQRVAA